MRQPPVPGCESPIVFHTLPPSLFLFLPPPRVPTAASRAKAQGSRWGGGGRCRTRQRGLGVSPPWPPGAPGGPRRGPRRGRRRQEEPERPQRRRGEEEPGSRCAGTARPAARGQRRLAPRAGESARPLGVPETAGWSPGRRCRAGRVRGQSVRSGAGLGAAKAPDFPSVSVAGSR